MPEAKAAAPPRVRTALRRQAEACRRLGSPFTARLLALLAERLREDSVVGRVILHWPGDPIEDALALRLAAALHAIVLVGRDRGLAGIYPPAPDIDDRPFREAVETALDDHAEALLRFVDSPPQTNEIGRSAVLAAGFLTIAERTSLPLALFEIGSSAGLNLRWDSYGHDLGGVRLPADDGAPVLEPEWRGPPPPAADFEVTERRGCDRKPVDLASAEAAYRLRAYVWPDQPERLNRLDQALAVARRTPVTIDRADAADWAEIHLTSGRPGATTVLFHSIVWQYIPEDRRARLHEFIHAAGRKATVRAPFAWLRMEPHASGSAALQLTLWPGGRTHHLADVDYHGRWIDWRTQS